MELARRLREGKMPEGVPSSLDVDHTTEAVPSTFPNGCHVAEVEIDPDTGIVQIVRYTGVNDFGTIVNPMLVAGQLHGGVAQGIGQALMECVSYDASGQPITGSFMDYALPRAEDIPLMAVGDHPVPAKSNPLGTKGCGEAGCAGSSLHHRQRGARCAVRIRHHPHRHAADAGAGVARDPGREAEGGVRRSAIRWKFVGWAKGALRAVPTSRARWWARHRLALSRKSMAFAHPTHPRSLPKPQA